MFNFMKGSFFSRNTGNRQETAEAEKDVQVLAVWGSFGSGKTTVSVKLAKHLADKKRNVALCPSGLRKHPKRSCCSRPAQSTPFYNIFFYGWVLLLSACTEYTQNL